jgi:hypothetical protein
MVVVAQVVVAVFPGWVIDPAIEMQYHQNCADVVVAVAAAVVAVVVVVDDCYYEYCCLRLVPPRQCSHRDHR